MRLTLRARILAAFLIALVLFVAVLGFGIAKVRGLSRELGHVQDVWLPLAQQVGALRARYPDTDPDEILKQPARTRTSVLEIRRIRLQGFNEQLIEAQKAATAALRDPSTDPQAAEQLQKLVTALGNVTEPSSRYVPLLNDLLAAAETGPPDLVEQRRNAFASNDRVVQVDVDAASLAIEEGLHGDVISAERKAQSSLIALALLTAVVTGFGLAATLLVGRALSPIGELIAGVQQLSSGDFSRRVDVRGEGEVALLAGEFNKMAERLASREERLKSQEQALVRSERLAAIGRMSSQITHEVRNPLNSLSLNVEMLEEEIGEGREAKELLKAIASEIDRLNDITEGYLSFARLPKPKLSREQINGVVEGLLRFLKEEAEGAGVRVSSELGGGIPEVLADENQLRQALLNVVRNALEAIRGNGKGGNLKVATHASDGWVELTLADDGPGIAQKDLSRIFDPFYSTKAEGTGLGLPLTQQIIEEHGGTIACASEPGKGTTFTIRLPAAPANGAG
jgi:two-component system NtrC family sensor kinase